MDVDRYITDEAVRTVALTAFGAADSAALDEAHDVLLVALPGILAQHRADVLREAAVVIAFSDADEVMDDVATLMRLADEAVAE